jgi:hypothetical protein
MARSIERPECRIRRWQFVCLRSCSTGRNHKRLLGWSQQDISLGTVVVRSISRCVDVKVLSKTVQQSGLIVSLMIPI